MTTHPRRTDGDAATLCVALAALTIAAVGCTSGDDTGDTADTGPDITLGTVPDPEAVPTDPAPHEPGDTEPDCRRPDARNDHHRAVAVP